MQKTEEASAGVTEDAERKEKPKTGDVSHTAKKSSFTAAKCSKHLFCLDSPPPTLAPTERTRECVQKFNKHLNLDG